MIGEGTQTAQRVARDEFVSALMSAPGYERGTEGITVLLGRLAHLAALRDR